MHADMLHEYPREAHVGSNWENAVGGAGVGAAVGGAAVGDDVGCDVGEGVGDHVGDTVGATVGPGVGDAVGEGVDGTHLLSAAVNPWLHWEVHDTETAGE